MSEEIVIDEETRTINIQPKNKCGHFVTHTVTLHNPDGSSVTYCLKCLFEKSGIEGVKNEL